MQIEVWSDVVCPWCYIGKRRLEMALAKFPHWESVQVIWRSFELDRDSPRHQPGTLEEMLSRKYAVSPQQAAAMNAQVTEVAKEVGLDYRLAEAHPGNTFDAHRLIHFAESRQLGDGAAERLMHAYFSESLAVGDRAALARLAPEFNISEKEALAMLESEAYSDEVRADEARAAEFGITVVPYFVIDESIGISGAQPVEVFSTALQQAWTDS